MPQEHSTSPSTPSLHDPEPSSAAKEAEYVHPAPQELCAVISTSWGCSRKFFAYDKGNPGSVLPENKHCAQLCPVSQPRHAATRHASTRRGVGSEEI